MSNPLGARILRHIPPPRRIFVVSGLIAMAPAAVLLAGRGCGHPEKTSVAVFQKGESQKSVLQGFTLTGGKGSTAMQPRGGGLFVSKSSPAIRDCLVTGNSARRGGGAYLVDSAGGAVCDRRDRPPPRSSCAATRTASRAWTCPTRSPP